MLFSTLCSTARLITVLMPKFNDLQDDAHKTSVKLTANSLRGAVNLTHSLWQSQGSSNKTELLKGFGSGNILMGKKGWPIDAIDLNGKDSTVDNIRFSLTSSTCVRLWNSLLKDSAPKVAELTGSFDANNDVEINIAYFAQFTKGTCRYRYRLNQDELRIDYDLLTGQVSPLF